MISLVKIEYNYIKQQSKLHYLVILLFIFITTTTTTQAQNTWTAKANFGGGIRSEAVAFNIGAKGYFGTGSDGTVNKKDWWEYDPVANTWTQKADFGGSIRSSASGFVIGSKGYVGIGTGAGLLNDFWEYDPALNTWTQKANFAGSARQGSFSFSTGTKGYIGGGFDGGYVNTMYEYDPTANTWTQKANYPGSARYVMSAFAIDNLGYIGTGEDAGSTYYSEFYQYNPNANTWTAKANFGGGARDRVASFVIGNKGYFALGFDGSNKQDLYEYDASLNTWTAKANFSGTARYSARAFVVNNLAYVGTGFDGARLQDFYQYTPGTTPSVNTNIISSITATTATSGGTISTDGNYAITAKGVVWSTSANPTVALATKTNDGTGAGSFTSSITGLSAGTQYYYRAYATNSQGTSYGIEYTFTTTQTGGTWARQTDFIGTRYSGVAFSIGSKGYYGTGWNGSSRFKDFWEYDPTTCQWTQKADFGGVARDGAVGFSIGTKGYLGTGDNGTIKLSDFWEFDPTGNTWTQKTSLTNERSSAVGFAIGAKGYILTGTNSGGRRIDVVEYDPSLNTWTAKANFPGTPRTDASGFGIGTKGYFGLGYDNSIPNNDFYEFDPLANTWTAKASYSGAARGYATAFAIAGKGYIGTGFNGGNLSNFFEYNPTNNTWTAITAFAGSARYYSSNFVIDSVAYVVTGYDGSFKSDMYSYKPNSEPTITTTAISSLSTTSASSGGNVLGDGGTTVTSRGLVWSATVNPPTISSYDGITSNSTGTGAFTQTVNALCPGTTYYVRAYATNSAGTSYGATETFTTTASPGDIWVQKANFGGTARNGAVAFTINDNLYISTGQSNSNLENDIWEYNISSNVWTQKANFIGIGRKAAAGFSISGKGYLGSGYLNTLNTSRDFYEYNPTTNVWTAKSNFGGAVREYATAFSIGTKGYMGLGITTGMDYQDMWEYDPSLDTWTQKANFGGGVRYGVVAFVLNSKAYIGTGYSSSYKQDIWEFNPSTNIWTQKANYGGGNRAQATAFSIGNKGYVGLGYNGTTVVNDFWEYDPTLDSWLQKTNYSGVARQHGIGVSLSNKGYFGLGYDVSNRYQDFYEYTPNTIPQFISGSAGSITSSGAAISATYDANYNGCSSSAITDHGLVWHTATAPTTGTNTGTVSAGAGTSTISHTITGLTANTTYYVRSYSTSAQGTRFGNEVSFTTSAGAPTVTTTAITSVAPTSASSGGNVTSDGGAAVTARGLVWSATVNPPTIASYDGITTNSTGTGAFTQTINALCPGITYYVRAYATNSQGTSYGASETFTTTASPGDIWVQKTSFPNGARYQSCQFTIGNKLYIGMGTTGVSNYDDLWEYDVNADTWTQKTSFPNGLITGTINFAINGKGYVCGGVIGGFWQKTVFEYDPTLNNWTQKNDIPLSGGFANRSNGLGLANSTRGYIIGGFDCSLGRAYTEIIEYNPTSDSWVQRPDFHNRSSSKPSGFIVDENLYVYATGNCVSVMENSFFSYNTSTNTWSNKAPFPGTASVRGIGFAIGKKGYIGTGREQSLAVSNSLFEYDVATDIWKQISNVPTAGTEYANGISIGNKAYYGLGASIGVNWYEYTPSTIPALLITSGVSSVSSSGGIVSAVTDANFNGCATNSITSKGIILGTSNSFTLSNASFTFTNGSGNSNFSTTLSGLSPATTYFARAFSTSAAGSNYGNAVSFTTLADLPTITTTAISNLTSVDVESGGIITSDGGATVTARGVVWSTNPNPTVALATKTNDASGTGTYSSTVTGLTPGTVYYLRAYATNSVGTAYGSEATFTTLNIPSLTTVVPDNITGTDAQSGGVIISDGNDPITAKGVVWDINPNPTVALVTKTNDGSGISSFGSVVNGLSYNTDYYVRAYATNSTGTAYGQQEFFTSNASSVVLLNDVYLTGERGFTFVATATDDGGQAITERGVVWGASRNPRITNEKKTFGNGLGLFRGTVLDLLPETKYYVRTYLINSDGISYSSNQIVYTADNDAVPTVTELQAPNNGDGNGDGIPDYAQRNVVTIRSTNGNYVTIASTDPNKEILVPQALASLERNPNFDYPHGMYSFSINASSATITMYFHGITNLSNAVYRKATASGLWANFPFVTFSSVMIGTTRVATATLVLTDGSFGDSDGIANGVITDPGGPAIPAAAVSNIPTISEWARIFLISLLLVLGVWKIRKYV